MTTDHQREHRRIANHPVMKLLLRAANRETIYPDEIADLRLPDRQAAALDQAITRLRSYTDTEGNPAPVATDAAERYNHTERHAAAIIDSLPDHWEDRTTHNQRRAGMGDPEALAAVRAEAEGYDHIADQVDHGVSIR